MRVAWTVAAVCLAATAAGAQGQDAGAVLAAARQAMGGEKLATVKSLAATGRTLRTMPGGSTAEAEFELALELPDKYLMRSVLAAMGNMSVYRLTGFNGSQVIDEVDRPPSLQGGSIMIRVAGPGGAALDPEKMTPEQRAEYDRNRLLANKREYARLALGLFAAPPGTFPLEASYVGTAESPDGKADVIEFKGEGDFSARLFVHADTHLPLMLSWNDLEPIVLQVGGPGGAVAGAGGTARVVQRGPGPMSKEEREQLEKDMEARRAEAEKNRRTVEFRVFYGDYQEVGGVLLPHRIQRSIDGKTTEEMTVERFRINPKLDARKFQPTK